MSTLEFTESLDAALAPGVGDGRVREIAAQTWDALIIGAGPAGSVAAAQLAGRGWRVLLVERARWPREKACGGCLNAAGVGMLERVGLGHVLQDAVPLHEMVLQMGHQRLCMPVPAGRAIERRELDRRLVAAAMEAGAVFLPQTLARVTPGEPWPLRRVALMRGGERWQTDARLVLACDGVRGNSLVAESWARVEVHRRVRLGFAATVDLTGDDAALGHVPWGRVAMYAGTAGYVGLTRLPDAGEKTKRLHVGAALLPAACHERGGPREVMRDILRHSGFGELPALEEAEFVGTGPLTVRRPVVAGWRVMAVGDACGYVEPFTGEGIAWAIRGAIEVAAILPARAQGWNDALTESWQRRYAQAIRRRQRWCSRFAACGHRPWLAAVCVAVARGCPGLAARIAERIGRQSGSMEFAP